MRDAPPFEHIFGLVDNLVDCEILFVGDRLSNHIFNGVLCSLHFFFIIIGVLLAALKLVVLHLITLLRLIFASLDFLTLVGKGVEHILKNLFVNLLLCALVLSVVDFVEFRNGLCRVLPLHFLFFNDQLVGHRLGRSVKLSVLIAVRRRAVVRDKLMAWVLVGFLVATYSAHGR